LYKLEGLRRVRDRVFTTIDALLLPTIPTAYTVEEVLAEPITLNSRLGTYTNFVNLLDLCGLAVPSSVLENGTPFGLTLLAPAGQDAQLAALGRVLHAASALPLGARRLDQPPLAPVPAVPAADEIAIAVVGAHLTGAFENPAACLVSPEELRAQLVTFLAAGLRAPATSLATA
jgi:allophanate hydrolase